MEHPLDHTQAHIDAVNGIRDMIVSLNKQLPTLVALFETNLSNAKAALFADLDVATIAEAKADLPNHFSDQAIPTIEAAYDHLEAILAQTGALGDIGTVATMSIQELSEMLDTLKLILEKTKLAESEMIEING